MNRNIKITKGIGTSLGTPKYMGIAENNSKFCTKLLSRSPMPILLDDTSENSQKRQLIYDLSKSSKITQDTLQSIIDLLLQLRASQDDQNVFVQNNTVVRQQILNQLKNELLNVRNNLNQGQIKKLEVISSNSFDAKTLNDVLKSLLEDSKKKLETEKEENEVRRYRNTGENVSALSNVYRSYVNIINLENKYKKTLKTVSEGGVFERFLYERRFINIKKSVESKTANLLPQKESPPKKSRAEEIFAINKTEKNILRPAENIIKIYKQKNIVSQYTDLLKVKFSALEIQKRLKSRSLDYIIYKHGVKKHESINKTFENEFFEEKLKKQYEFKKLRINKETQEKNLNIDYRVDFLEKKTSNIVKKINKNISVVGNLQQSIYEKNLISKNTLLEQNKIISKTVDKNEIDNVTSKRKLAFYSKEIHKNILENVIKKDVLNKVTDVTENRLRYKNILINSIELEKLKKEKKENVNYISDKYNITRLGLSDIISTDRIVKNKKLINKNLENKHKINEIETVTQEIDKKISNIKIKNANINKKILNKQKEISTIKFNEVYNKFINKNQKESVTKKEFYKKNVYIDLINEFNKDIVTNKVFDSQEDIIKKVKSLTIKNKKLINKDKIIDEINLVKKDKNFTILESEKINKTNKVETVYDLDKVHIKKISLKTSENKNEILNVNNIYEQITNRVKQKTRTTKNLVNIINDEKVINTTFEKNKTIFAKRPPVINQKDIDLIIKTTSQEITNKILTSSTIKHTHKEITDENLLFNTKKIAEKVLTQPTIIRQKTKNIKEVKNNIYSKIFSRIPPKIKDVNKKVIKEKTLYREVEQTNKLYFNNLQENIEERVLLDRQKVSTVEPIYREIEKNTVIYKKPINLKQISEKIQKEQIKEQKTTPLSQRAYKTETVKEPYVYPTKKQTERPKEKGLTRDDVMKMIQSYMGDFDLDEISNRIVDRVEEEMISQRRRNGII